MVELKFIGRSAPFTGRFFPFALLHWREPFSVSGIRTAENRSHALWPLEHFVSISNPSFTESRTHFSLRFRSVFVALRRTALFSRIRPASQRVSDAQHSFFAVNFSPKRIVLSSELLALAFKRFASHSIVSAFKIIRCAIDFFAADETREEFAGSWWCHISDNGVNSVNTPLYHNQSIRAIPSEALQECRERVTTRAGSPERTVKPHEHPTRKGRDSLSYAVTHRSAGKELRDNISGRNTKHLSG